MRRIILAALLVLMPVAASAQGIYNPGILPGSNASLASLALTGNSLALSGNRTSAAWLTAGIAIRQSAATYTDTTSSGAVSAVMINRIGNPTIAFSSASTVGSAYGTYFDDPVAGTNATLTAKYAIGADSIRVVGATVVMAALAATGAGDVFVCVTTGGTLTKGATCVASSREFKTNIRPLERSCKMLEKIRSVTFDWKDGAPRDHASKRDVGFIAEEMARVDQRLALWRSGKPYSVNDRAVMSVAVGCVQEQASLISAMQRQARAENNNIAVRLARLERANMLKTAARK